jgi:hypothetical protein
MTTAAGLIRQRRTADATVTVIAAGAPLANRQVTLAQRSRKFLFGCIGFDMTRLANGRAGRASIGGGGRRRVAGRGAGGLRRVRRARDRPGSPAGGHVSGSLYFASVTHAATLPSDGRGLVPRL